MTKDYRRELQGLLRKLFQFDSADLDFGIYRIMNFKRDEIDKFIEEDLIKAVDVEFEKYSEKSKGEIEKELEEIRKRIASTLGEEALLPSGDLKEMYRSFPIAKEFYKKKEDLKNSEMADQHKAEIFSHIYQFFSRYYDEGDFISQRRYSRQNKYAIPYNGEEVLLHWANKDQYYIKTGEYFKSYSFKSGDYKINFRLLDVETDHGNNHSGNRFFLLKESLENITYDESAKELIIFFEYRDLAADEIVKYGTRDVQKKILEEVNETIMTKIHNSGLEGALQKSEGERTLLGKHLLRYTKKNTTDYFIHKDLGGFLSGELDFYIKNEVLMIGDLGSEKEIDIESYIGRVKVIKAIGSKVIDFLAQIEEFQKKLYEKKKFVLRTNYCMTIDHVPKIFFREIIANEKQLSEWRRLYRIGYEGSQTVLTGGHIDESFLENHPYLVLDTAFFDEIFTGHLLENMLNPNGKPIEDLDGAIGGLMIKSENLQALNLLQEGYQNHARCIYIDPPYNTSSSKILYKNNYEHSSWLSLLFDRVTSATNLLAKGGIFEIAIDDVEMHRLRYLLDSNFGEENRLGTIAVLHNPGGRHDDKFIATSHEYFFIYANNKNYSQTNDLQLSDADVETFKYSDDLGDYRLREFRRSGSHSTRQDRPNLYYPIYYDPEKKEVSLDEKKNETIEILPIDPQGIERCWRWGKESLKTKISHLVIRKGKNGLDVKLKAYLADKQGLKPKTLWKEPKYSAALGTILLKNIFGEEGLFPYPKSLDLMKDALFIGSDDDSLIIDFFAGSGTTAHAILELNKDDGGSRRYILVEIGDHFNTVLKPRIQKIVYSANWKNGKPQDTDGQSHIFKYIELEQYEDTLDNIEFFKSGTVQRTLEELDGYFLRYMLDFETRDSPCRMNVDKFNRPFDYTLKITRNNSMQDTKVDLVETFNYLIGLHIEKIKSFQNNGVYYRVVHGKKDDDTITIIWRATSKLDLKIDKEFIEDNILKEFKSNKVYVNSECFVEGAIPIEPEFKHLMEA